MPGGASLPAAAGLGTTEWDLRLTLEPAPLGGEKGMQSCAKQCRGFLSIPTWTLGQESLWCFQESGLGRNMWRQKSE